MDECMYVRITYTCVDLIHVCTSTYMYVLVDVTSQRSGVMCSNVMTQQERQNAAR